MGANSINRQGDFLPLEKIVVTNRTGGALVKGGIYKLDLAASDGDVTAYATWRGQATRQLENSPLGNIIAVGANTADESGIFVVATDTSADNVTCEVVLRGVCQVLAAASSSVAIGMPYKPVASAATVQTYTTGLAAIGVALEAGGASSGLIWAYHSGIAISGANVGTV